MLANRSAKHQTSEMIVEVPFKIQPTDVSSVKLLIKLKKTNKQHKPQNPQGRVVVRIMEQPEEWIEYN